MKSILNVALLLVVLVAFASCKNSAGTTSSKSKSSTQQKAVVYTCPMHPEVTSDKPGKCPKCGMALVKK